MDIISIFFNMKVCCVFSLESPHRGDSNEYTQYTIFNVKENHPKLFQICGYGFLFRGTQERVRNTRLAGKYRWREFPVVITGNYRPGKYSQFWQSGKYWEI